MLNVGRRLKFAASIITCATTLLAASNSFAAAMQSYCYMAENDKDVVGKNENQKMPIASVSKVLTSLAVLSKLGATAKLYTQFYAMPVAKDVYDVHIKGSRDPYFARASMHTLISRLNEMGVTRIRTLTFDENFKYLYNTNQVNSAGRGKWFDPVTGKAPIDAPSGDFIRLLLLNKRQVMLDYDKSKKDAATDGVKLVDKPVFDPEKIELVSSTFKPPAKAKTGYVASMKLIDIIKYMNWNSNNHVANSLFLIAGGKEKVEDFYYKKLKVNPAELTFVNGSGQNGDLTGNGRTYTEASCSVMVRTLRALKLTLEAQTKPLKLQDALAVGGGDIGSTIDAAVYKKYLPAKTVIAKTGTVGVAISLAGLANTKQGNFFFMYNVEPGDAPRRYKGRNAERWRMNEAAKSRGMIGQKLATEMDSLEAGNALGLEITNPKIYKQRKLTASRTPGPRGQAIAYNIRHYDVVNFEDSGDENAPELAEEDTKGFLAKAKGILSSVVTKLTPVYPQPPAVATKPAALTPATAASAAAVTTPIKQSAKPIITAKK